MEVVEETQETLDVETLSDEDLGGYKVDEDTSEQQETSEVENNQEEQVQKAEASEEEPVLSIEDLAKKVDGLSKLQARTQTELGNTRQQNLQLQNTLAQYQTGQLEQKQEEEIDIYTDPDAYVEKKIAARDEAKQKEMLLQEQSLRNNRAIISEKAPELENHINDIAEEIKKFAGEVPQLDQYVESFKSNPYAENPLVLYAFNEAVKYKKELSAIKSGQGSPDAMLNKIDKVARGKSVITGKSGQSSSGKMQFSSADLENLSDEELEAQIKQYF